MKSISFKHPERKEMIQAVKSGQVPFRGHLDQCESCRHLFELLSLCGESEQSTSIIQSSDSLYRTRAIALLNSSRQPSEHITGELAHDSWAGLPAQQVRDAAYSGERRLRYQAGDITLELVIEKTAGQYELAARVYESGKPTTRFLLQIGRQKLYPQNHKCFYWHSKRPPRRLCLLSADTKLELGTLAW